MNPSTTPAAPLALSKTPAKTTAQRQAAYRAKHLKSLEGQAARLGLVVDQSAKLALERLAVHHGVTQRAMLGLLVMQAQAVVLDGLDSTGQAGYYDKQPRRDMQPVGPVTA